MVINYASNFDYYFLLYYIIIKTFGVMRKYKSIYTYESTTYLTPVGAMIRSMRTYINNI